MGEGAERSAPFFRFGESVRYTNAPPVGVKLAHKTRSVILTKVRTQSQEDLRLVPWILTFVRMTDGISRAGITSILPCKGRWQRRALTEG
ncbi:hypothetical protein QFZ54_001485 [Sphingomonas faeni]|nr:hypothetical protein [Sphingomonas faeni]